MLVASRVPDEPPLEEGDVDDGRVEVDELEDEHFECEIVVEIRLSPVHLWGRRCHDAGQAQLTPDSQSFSHVLVHSAHRHDRNQIDLER